MNIQIDSREKSRAITKIVATFDKANIKHYVSKLYVGDYMNLDNPRLIIDRKQNLTELCANVCQGHERFRSELLRAKENGIKLIILCEHGKGINSIDDVANWINPRGVKRVKNPITGKWEERKTNAMTGQVLCKILHTLKRKYDCEFLFCDKSSTGKMIIDLLKVKNDG